MGEKEDISQITKDNVVLFEKIVSNPKKTKNISERIEIKKKYRDKSRYNVYLLICEKNKGGK